MRWLRKLERGLFIFGLLLLGLYVGARIQGAVLSRVEVQTFESRLSGSAHLTETGSSGTTPDFSLWSLKRIRDYREGLASHFSPVVAILRIQKIHLEVPVANGTDDLTLNWAVGLIPGTARPGESGNIGIAGHRDGFFRGLKGIHRGDTLQIVTRTETTTYVIDHIVIVAPSDVSVLGPRTHSSVTLVTCYPFYFVGSAPQRYIVQASVRNQDKSSQRATRNAMAELQRR